MTDKLHEAIVRAALERASNLSEKLSDKSWESSEAWAFDEAATAIHALADDPAEVAAIIKKAGEQQ
jgi:hypothetical protein